MDCCAQALDLLTCWAEKSENAELFVANTSQNIDRMSPKVDEESPFPCITS